MGATEESETGDESESETGDETESETESETETETESETETGEELPEGFCDDACAVVAEGSCLLLDGCLSYCEAEGAAWTTEIGEAFAACAMENPLCFESIEGCILAELNPLLTIRVEGADFEAHEGKLVNIWHDPGVEPVFGGEAAVEAGSFAFEWVEELALFDSMGPLMLLYIDDDESGTCNADADLTAAVSPEWNGDYLEPVFIGELSPPLNPAAFVCGFLP